MMPAAPIAPLALPKPQWRTLTSLGHVIDRSIAARAGVLKRLTKAGLSEPLAPWLAGIDASFPPDEGVFVVALEINAGAIRVRDSFLDGADVEAAMPDLPQLVTPPGRLRNTVWSALFKLRPLRQLWALEMRSNLLETLDKVSATACLLDPTPLPPGSLIGGLDIPSWEQLADLRKQGRTFEVHASSGPATSLSAGDSPQHWKECIREALERFPERAAVLSETTALDGASNFLAAYVKKADRVDLLRVVSPSGESVAVG